MEVPPSELFKFTIRQLLGSKKLSALVFFVVLIVVLLAGSFMPKHYTSSTTLKLQDEGVMQPLLRERAVVGGTKEWVQGAKQIVFSHEVLSKVVKKSQWEGADLSSDRVVVRLQEKIRDNASIVSSGKSYIKFTYTDKNRIRAFEVVHNLANEFVINLLDEKREKSQDAFEFIGTQVNTYKENLVISEENLKRFKRDNFDGTITGVLSRVSSLEQQIEAVDIELSGYQLKLQSLEGQVSKERKIKRGADENSGIIERIAVMNRELDQMRLSYHDSYPDVISLKGRIDELKHSLKPNQGVSSASNSHQKNRSGQDLLGQLRAEVSKIKAEIAAMNVRKSKLEALLAEQKEKSTRLHGAEAELAELTRDYNVNKNIYQDLLMRRENARVSMNIELEEKGASFQIVRPAKIPLIPEEPPFWVFFLAAPFAGLLAPILLAFAIIFLDKKIRHPMAIREFIDVPVLQTIPHWQGDGEQVAERREVLTVIALLIISASVYAAVGYYNFFKSGIWATL